MNIFEFSDHRDFLKIWLKSAKSKGISNVNRLAQAIEVHPTYLSQVLSGAKNLSLEQAANLSHELKLTEIEQQYFFVLIQLDKAGTQRLRAHWKKEKDKVVSEYTKLNSRMGSHHELSDTERAIYYSSWIYSAVFIATSLDKPQTLEAIVERFNLTREKASEILSFLIRSGICVEESGLYKMGKSRVYVPNDSPFVVKHHTNWRMKAIQKMDSREESELFFTSPVSMSKNDFAKVRELIARTIQESMEIVKDSPGEELFCLNIDYFKV